MKRNILLFICLATSILLLFGLNLTTGSVQIPFADILDILCGRFIGKESWEYIILENRLPQTLTAILCGASLSVCGLMLQTAFRNPLAGPDVIWNQFWCRLRCCLGDAIVGWDCLYFYLYCFRLSCHSYRSFRWSYRCNSTHLVPFHFSAQQCFITDSGYHGGICFLFCCFSLNSLHQKKV